MTTAPYEFGRMTSQCAASGRVLAPGEPFIAALFESTASEALERRDYSMEAWERSRPTAVFAFWRAAVPEPGAKTRQLIDDESLVNLFEQLEGADDAKRRAFRFVLALILTRKRLLVDVGRRSAGKDRPPVMLVRAKSAAPEEKPIEVIDPGLDAATIADVTEQVSSLIRADA